MSRQQRFGAVIAAVLVLAASALAVSAAPAGAAGLCAHFTGFTNTSTSVTVTFDVFSPGCVVTLTSYQSTINGPVNQKFSSGTFGPPSGSLTVPLTCGTDNQIDLFLGTAPPDASTDLHAFALTPSCAPPPNVCTYTKGFYKNHLSVVETLFGGGLSGTTLTLAQVEAVLTGSPSKLAPGSGGALNLAQQALTALLNEAKGAPPPAGLNSAIASALSSLSMTFSGGKLTAISSNAADVGGLTNTIDAFNESNDCG